MGVYRNRLPVIFGLAGHVLSANEHAFFADVQPAGFILFERNCESPDQVLRLVLSLANLVRDEDVPILIDQEGGRVQRLKPPQWQKFPPAGDFAKIYDEDPADALQAVVKNTRAMAQELKTAGVNVNCAPVADLLFPETSKVVGDRSYGARLDPVVALAGAVAQEFLAHKITPVIKHMPGHGRAVIDSHHDLPVVDVARSVLEQSDFAVFRSLVRRAGLEQMWGMTAHVIYSDIDPDLPATLSPVVIAEIIRGWIGFSGVLVTDDLGMKALKMGADRAAKMALDAGCDLALYGNSAIDGSVLESDLAMMQKIAHTLIS